MSESVYIFIDGAYLHRAYAQSVRRWFGFEPEMRIPAALSTLRNFCGNNDIWIPVNSSYVVDKHEIRSFYYDCLDEEVRANESGETFEARIEKQNERLRNLRDLDDCHIRLGALKGSKRRQQKEVDVLIAVDMMAHAARGNMDKAVLVSGDLDLRPAVEALVQLGISVQIISDEKTTSRELTWAASSVRNLVFTHFYGWSDPKEKTSRPLPREHNFLPSNDGTFVQEGLVKGNRCKLYKGTEEYFLYFPTFTLGPITEERTFVHPNLEMLELYFELRYEPIAWDRVAQ